MPYVSKINPIPDASLLRSLEVRPILRHERLRWDSLMRQHHYLGLKTLVGESIRYAAIYKGQWLALLSWSAAALNCKVRDRWIGWHPALKQQRLPLIANNSRFLILLQFKVPNLASRILSLNLKRLSNDWEAIYGHPIWLVETFVDPRYFKGTCYKAAGWSFLGYTCGFKKHSRTYTQHNNPKMVFIKSLQPDAKDKLSSVCLNYKLNKEVKSMEISEKASDDLIRRLSKIPEPRKPRGIRHQKISILAISICAIMCNALNFSAIAQWAKGCSQNMLKRLWCRYDRRQRRYIAPSEPTIRRLLQRIDTEAADAAIYGWLQTHFGDDVAVAVDGKTLKGAQREGGKKVHLLTAFLPNTGAPIAQREVEDTTNEIKTFRALLEGVDLKGKVITADAMHTQQETARYLVEEKGADYLFTVKNNQKTLREDIEDLRMVAIPPSVPNY